ALSCPTWSPPASLAMDEAHCLSAYAPRTSWLVFHTATRPGGFPHGPYHQQEVCQREDRAGHHACERDRRLSCWPSLASSLSTIPGAGVPREVPALTRWQASDRS